MNFHPNGRPVRKVWISQRKLVWAQDTPDGLAEIWFYENGTVIPYRGWLTKGNKKTYIGHSGKLEKLVAQVLKGSAAG